MEREHTERRCVSKTPRTTTFLSIFIILTLVSVLALHVSTIHRTALCRVAPELEVRIVKALLPITFVLSTDIPFGERRFYSFEFRDGKAGCRTAGCV